MPPADGDLPHAAACQPEPVEKTELTIAPEEELQHESDQGCEPTTSADEAIASTENEYWLIDFNEETSILNQ